MALHYKKGDPYFRRVSHTIRKGAEVPAITLEGQILSTNGLTTGCTVRIEPTKGGIIIRKIE